MKKELINMEVVITDLFCGELNFSWVDKFTFSVNPEITNRQALKIVRDHFGITSKLRQRYDFSDELRYDIDKACIGILINFGG